VWLEDGASFPYVTLLSRKLMPRPQTRSPPFDPLQPTSSSLLSLHASVQVDLNARPRGRVIWPWLNATGRAQSVSNMSRRMLSRSDAIGIHSLCSGQRHDRIEQIRKSTDKYARAGGLHAERHRFRVVRPASTR